MRRKSAFSGEHDYKKRFRECSHWESCDRDIRLAVAIVVCKVSRVFRNVVSRGCWKKESFTSPPPEGKWHWNLQHVQSFDRNIRMAGLYCDVRWVRGGSEMSLAQAAEIMDPSYPPPPPPLHAREEVTPELAGCADIFKIDRNIRTAGLFYCDVR